MTDSGVREQRKFGGPTDVSLNGGGGLAAWYVI